MTPRLPSFALFATLMLAPSAAFAFDVEAGPLTNQRRAEETCPAVCSTLSFNGQATPSADLNGAFLICGTARGDGAIVRLTKGLVIDGSLLTQICRSHVPLSRWNGNWASRNIRSSVCGCDIPPYGG